MRFILSVAVIAVGCAVVCGCGKRETPHRVTRQGDLIVDRDFVTRIRKTNEPYVYEVSVEKVSKNANAAISGFPAVVDLTLKDASGKVFAGKNPDKPQYAKEIGDAFSTARDNGGQRLTGKVRLLRDDLRPGTYIVQPRARIRQTWTITDYPAANSVQVTIR